MYGDSMKPERMKLIRAELDRLREQRPPNWKTTAPTQTSITDEELMFLVDLAERGAVLEARLWDWADELKTGGPVSQSAADDLTLILVALDDVPTEGALEDAIERAGTRRR